ncbi:MAG: ribonuclease HII [Bacteriovoracaceae bacterium]|jgi:ribonuclease HII
MPRFESKYILTNDNAIAGSDEVGRGPLAGPVVGATVVLSKPKAALKVLGKLNIDDSKKLNSKKRDLILEELSIDLTLLKQGSKIAFKGPLKGCGYFSIVEISPLEIDKINILQASLKAMRESFKIARNKTFKGSWLIDGNRSPESNLSACREVTVIKGDSKSKVIGLASIIAKQYRDRLMSQLSLKYPGYGFEKNSGYPTQFHRKAIGSLGVTKIHRRSFKGVKEFL